MTVPINALHQAGVMELMQVSYMSGGVAFGFVARLALLLKMQARKRL
jgi:hypothetical protein